MLYGFNYYDSDNVLSLGKGIEVSGVLGTGVGALYCRISDLDCGLLIMAIPFGFSGALSLIIGGSLVPVKN